MRRAYVTVEVVLRETFDYDVTILITSLGVDRVLLQARVVVRQTQGLVEA